MPTYVYACDACGAHFEQFQSFRDDPVRTCPRCAGAVRRVFQPVGIVFKGSGWYITDSRKSSSATVSSDERATKSDTSEKTTSDKPATESTAKSDTSSSASTDAKT